ncbi:MAG: hypothetical protein WKF31_03070 [Thermoleophilaceae bacterium]
MGIRRDHMGVPALDQVEREAARARAAIGARKRERGHLHEGAAAHHLGEPLGLPLQGGIALGVREQDAKAAQPEPEEQLLEAVGKRSVGRLEQQIAAALPV